MTFEERLAAAHQELASKGVWHANYNPPLCRLLRRFGYPVKPPQYEGWLTNFLVFGVGVGLVWGTMMWFFSWQSMGIDPVFALRHTTLFAGFFGLTMASWLWLRRKQLKLTPWEQLTNPADADDEEEELNEIP